MFLYGKTNKRTKKYIKQIKTKESGSKLMDRELQFILIIYFDITIHFDYFAEHFNLIFTKFSHQLAVQLNTVIICYSSGLKLAVCNLHF